MQEIILRKAEMAVKSLEDDIRMINIEISETERKIKVARDKILVVPKMAEKMLEIQ
jgi:predicted  nucleic acid-binding Zn-ribbon protein